MTLYISKEAVKEKDTFSVPYSWLQDKAVHLFIASTVWDKLHVDISEEIPLGVLKYVITKCAKPEVTLPSRKLTQHELSVLCEVYPYKAGGLRREHIISGDLQKVIRE